MFTVKRTIIGNDNSKHTKNIGEFASVAEAKKVKRNCEKQFVKHNAAVKTGKYKYASFFEVIEA